MSQQEELLDYCMMLGWHTTGPFFLRMTDATFQKHVRNYLRQQGIAEPTQEQLVQARRYCQHVSFWENISDPNVYRQIFGHQER